MKIIKICLINFVFYTIILFYITNLNAQNITDGSSVGIVKDIDGNLYHTVKIGNLVWMVENLKVTHYRNGDEIPNVKDNNDWIQFTNGAWCDYDNKPFNGLIYGKLYNYYILNDGREVAPIGWHISTEDDWKMTTNYLGGVSVAGKMRSKGIRNQRNLGLNITNEVGFCAIICGLRFGLTQYYQKGSFFGLNDRTLWWCKSYEPTVAFMSCFNNQVLIYKSNINNDSRQNGHYLRCVRDQYFNSEKDNKQINSKSESLKITNKKSSNINLPLKEIITDFDGNKYNSVKIGNQIWMVENLKVTHYRNGDLIANVIDNSAWSNLSTGAYYVYDNDVNIEADLKQDFNYGKLYNWYALGDRRNVSPTGWHVASDKEWKTLISFLGGENIAGGKLKSVSFWQNENIDASDIVGFSALPVGFRSLDGRVGAQGQTGYFWSSTPNDMNTSYFISISYNSGEAKSGTSNIGNGFSVRCVKD